MRPARFGIGLRGDRQASEYRHLGQLAEELGFDVVSVFADLGYQPPLGPLLEVAAATQRVSVGPACLNPYTLHPAEIAGQVAALDIASNGRAYLGLARGAWLGSIGVSQPRPVQTIREAADVVRLLMAGDPAGYRGEIFTVEPGFRLRHDVIRKRVPLLIGGWGERTVELAGEIADELKVGGSANILLVFEVVASHDPTVDVPDGLVEKISRKLRAGDALGAGRLIPDELLDRFAFSGTPNQVSRQVRHIFEAGAARVEFGAPFGLDADRGLRLLGERVLPEFR